MKNIKRNILKISLGINITMEAFLIVLLLRGVILAIVIPENVDVLTIKLTIFSVLITLFPNVIVTFSLLYGLKKIKKDEKPKNVGK